MDPDDLLGNHNLFESNDPDFVRDTLQRVVGITSFDISDGPQFFFRANLVSLDQITLASYHDRAGTLVRFAPDDVVRQLICMRGSYDFELRHQPTQANPTEWSALVPQNERYSLAAAPNSALISMRIDQSAIRRKIETLIGDCIGGEIRFEADTNTNMPALASLRRAILYAASELSFEHATYPSLAMRELQELLVVKFILAHRHNFSHLIFAKTSVAPSPWQLRRVEEYIEANWSKPISIDDLAAIAGVSGRTLLRHFRTWRGMTPMDFVKQLRLKHSKKLLEEPSSRTTVLSVALLCGFQSPGHFSRDYRKAFGELPSETLKRELRRAL
jgi:AraC-like DNA-binding protein